MGARTPSPRLPLFSIRLASATKSRWREAAEREGRTLAGYIKHAVDSYLRTQQAHSDPAQPDKIDYCDRCIQYGPDVNNPVKHWPEDCPERSKARP